MFLSLGFAHAQSHGASAMEPEGRLLFTAHHYGMEAGLPHRSVTSIAQDDRGFLWVSTPRGLARFDGYGFRTYSVADGLASNEVRQVECDREGMLWVLHMNEKLDIMDPRTGRVASVQDHFAGRLPKEAVEPFTSMSASQEGDIVFTSMGYMLRYQGQKKPFEVMPVDCANRLGMLLVTGSIEAWCSCNTTGEYVIKNDLLRIPFTGHGEGRPAQKFLQKNGFFPYPQPLVRDLSRWRPSRDPGTYFRIGNEMTWTPTGGDPVHGGKGRSAIHYQNQFMSLLMPLSDDVWLVNTTVRRMHAGDAPFTAPVLFDLATVFPDASFLAQTAMRDRTGNVWVGGEFGLYKINMQQAHFQPMLQDTTRGERSGYRIRGMLVTGGRLHVNTEEQGYWVLDAASGAVVSTEVDNRMRQMMIGDGHGGMWRAEDVDILHEVTNGHVDRTIHAPEGAFLPWSAVMLKDGGILIGTTKGMRIAGVHDDSSRVCHTGRSVLDQAWIWYLAHERNGQLLACTNAGLFRLDEQGQVRERWWSGALLEKDTVHYLPTDDIRYCHTDAEGIYWLATASNGLLRWDRSTGEVRSLGKRDGIPEASIHAILADADGMLWMPTDNGLVRYDPVSGEAKTFTTNDGLPSNEFNRLAFTQGPDGRFYFGGLNGIIAFNPADLRAPVDQPMAPLVIGGVYKQLEENQGQEDLTAQVLGGDPITMHSSDRFFTVDMALLSYEDPAQIRYAWRIEGVDKVWNVQQEPHLRINTLPYGDHMLRIKAMDAKGRWTEALLSIPIIMVPPLYLRWWFILGAVLLLSFAIYQVVRYRERQLRSVLTMRGHIASDLHDEVGSTLSSIVLFSSAVGKQTDGLSKEAMSMLKRIKDNSTRAMESMNDIVWSVNSDHDPMENLFDRMRAYARPLCETAGIELVFDLDKSLVMRKLGMEQRKNIYLVFKEAVNNAVKHARCARIAIHIREVAGALELMVLDNGTGYLPSGVDRGRLGGNGLTSMRRRAAEIGGTLNVSARTDGGSGTQVVFRSPMDKK